MSISMPLLARPEAVLMTDLPPELLAATLSRVAWPWSCVISHVCSTWGEWQRGTRKRSSKKQDGALNNEQFDERSTDDGDDEDRAKRRIKDSLADSSGVACLASDIIRDQRAPGGWRGREAVARAQIRCANSEFVMALGAKQPRPFKQADGEQAKLTSVLHFNLLCELIEKGAVNIIEWLLPRIWLFEIGPSLAVLARTGRVDFLETVNGEDVSFTKRALDVAVLYGHHDAALWLYQRLVDLGPHTGQELLLLQGVVTALTATFRRKCAYTNKNLRWLMVAAVASGRPDTARKTLKAMHRSSIAHTATDSKCRFLCRHSAIVRRDEVMLAWLDANLSLTFDEACGALEVACMAWPTDQVALALRRATLAIRTTAMVFAARNAMWDIVEHLWRDGVNIARAVLRLAMAHGDYDAMWRVLTMDKCVAADATICQRPQGPLHDWPITVSWQMNCQSTMLIEALIKRGHIDILEAIDAWTTDSRKHYPPNAIDVAAAQGDAGFDTLRWLWANNAPRPKKSDPCAAAARAGSLHTVRWLREVAQVRWRSTGFGACAHYCRRDPERGADLMAYAIRDGCYVPGRCLIDNRAKRYCPPILPLLVEDSETRHRFKDVRFAALSDTVPAKSKRTQHERCSSSTSDSRDCCVRDIYSCSESESHNSHKDKRESMMFTDDLSLDSDSD